MSGVAEQKPTNNYSMSTSEKYWQIRRHIRVCIAKYEKRIRKIESQKPKNETALGYFDQGRKAAYERVIADMIQYSEKEGQYDEE